MHLHFEMLSRSREWDDDNAFSTLQRIFNAAPHGYLLLDRDFMIVGVNQKYADSTCTDAKAILGKHLFDIFPDNPSDPAASGVKNLTSSLDRVLRTKQKHSMRWQSYDVRNKRGRFLERYWAPTNSPILNKSGEVALILHSVEDVTETVRNLDPSLRRAF